jgi:hypothetical protein
MTPLGGIGIVSTGGLGWDFSYGVGLEGEAALEYLIWMQLRKTQAVTTVVTTSIYLGTFPDRPAYPSILFSRVEGMPQNYLGQKPNKQNAVMQVDSFSMSYLTAYQLSTAVRAALSTATVFSNIELSNQDLSQALPDNTMLYRMSQHFSCWYKT